MKKITLVTVGNMILSHCCSYALGLCVSFFSLEQTKQALATQDLITSNCTQGRIPQSACTAQKV